MNRLIYYLGKICYNKTKNVVIEVFIVGGFDFTYELPENFNKRVVQYLQQMNRPIVANSFQRCKYEYSDEGLAYYAGLKGDNWDKKALDFTFEGQKQDISVLQAANAVLKSAIERALKPSDSGLLVRNIFYFDDDVSFETTKIPTSNEERLNADIATAKNVLNDFVQIGERICLNHSFNANSSENNINDAFRDMLFIKGYNEVKDQTRHGISSSGKDAAEVDILLTKEGKEIAIFEGLKLSSVNTTYIDEHIEKAILNYNALGTATFVVAYVCSANFESFWERYSSHIENYEFPLQIKRSFQVLPHPNAAIRTATMILSRDDYDFPVYFMALKLS